MPAAQILAATLLLVGAPGPTQVRESLRSVLERDQYQTKLPGEGKVNRPRAADSQRGRSSRRPAPVGGGFFAAVSQFLLWGLVALALFVAVLWLVRELRYVAPASQSARGDPSAGASAEDADTAVVQRPLDDADGLASQGRYGEAVHALLLRTFAELVRRTPRAIPDSLTSREILNRIELSPEPRGALAGLIEAVELSHFGGSEPTSEDFARCRSMFEAFAAAYRRGAA